MPTVSVFHEHNTGKTASSLQRYMIADPFPASDISNITGGKLLW